MIFRIIFIVTLGGCALEPTSIRIETGHISHLTQHFDGTPQTQQRGSYIIGTAVRWQSRRVFVELAEYWTPDIDGRHELFEGRFGYDISLRAHE